ncbi:MAG: hypothetical protein ABI573_05190 [Chloroflexota bacterium]
MRRVLIALAMAASMVGCGSAKSDQVPLLTVETDDVCCWLLYEVVDVIANPALGPVIKGSGAPLRWPRGYTAWRVGAEVKVLDPAGNVVLTTGGRYWLSPVYDGVSGLGDESNWIIGEVKPCPDCNLGSGPR